MGSLTYLNVFIKYIDPNSFAYFPKLWKQTFFGQARSNNVIIFNSISSSFVYNEYKL